MTMTQMGTLVLLLIVVLVTLRFNLHKKMRQGLPGFLASLSTSWGRLRAGVTYHQEEVQGYQLAYLDSGGSRELVIFLHGFGSDKDDWMKIARKLRRKYRLIAIDLPGFGESSRPSHNKHDIVSQVRRLRAFKEKLHLPSSHLVGQHMGATVGGLFASIYPKDVLSLTMIEPFGVDAPSKSDVERLSTRGWSPLTAGSQRDYERVLGLLYKRPPKMSSSLQKRKLARAMEHQAFEEQSWKQMWENRPYLFEQVLPEIKVRSLLFWGDSNKVAHVTGAKIVSQGMPAVIPVLVKGGSHMMILEKSKDVADRLLKFLSGEG